MAGVVPQIAARSERNHFRYVNHTSCCPSVTAFANEFAYFSVLYVKFRMTFVISSELPFHLYFKGSCFVLKFHYLKVNSNIHYFVKNVLTNILKLLISSLFLKLSIFNVYFNISKDFLKFG